MTDLTALLTRRPLVGESGIDIRFALSPGDRPLVVAGDSVVVGTPIAERLRDARLEDVAAERADAQPGDRVAGGELLFGWRGRWRVARGSTTETVDTPVTGIVREVRPGSGITLRATGRALRGIVVLGGPTHGRLQRVGPSDGELRAGGLDVSLAGAILVVGSRIDAETLTRARAMGVRGVIVGGLASKERRDFLASENRQRAALHRLPPFAVLVLEGAIRRPLPSPIASLLDGLVGHEVAIVPDPAALLFDVPDLVIDVPPPGHVRIRGGNLAGREGTLIDLPGQRRFAGGIQLEAGAVRLDDGSIVAVPLGDLETFGR